MIEGVVVDYKFQINLRGIIELLSNHLYSGPEVYLRELLQNGVDAIRARLHSEPDHQGEITLEMLGKRGGKPPTLVFTDNGIGLTEEEIHRFLATIGQSSKNAEFWDRPSDFIGQFGIGLLSCFVVSDEIVVITRSATPSPPTPLPLYSGGEGSKSAPSPPSGGEGRGKAHPLRLLRERAG